MLVLLISFFLAYQSMRDFRIVPIKTGAEYGLFLVKNPVQLSVDILNFFGDQIAKQSLTLSFERLFKGKQSALVIFGPRQILMSLKGLSVLELEDYTEKVLDDQIIAWEVGFKKPHPDGFNFTNLFEKLSELDPTDQFWWQVNLKAEQLKTNENLFYTQIRCVLISNDPQRRKKLALELDKLGAPALSKIPKPFSSQKILEFYQKRSLTLEKINPRLTAGEVLNLIALAFK